MNYAALRAMGKRRNRLGTESPQRTRTPGQFEVNSEFACKTEAGGI